MTSASRQFALPKLYAVTDSRLSGLSHPAQVEALCSGGAELIQLREKSLGANEFYSQARCAIKIAQQFGARVLINDRVDIALAAGADGVHLGQTDLPPAVARRLLGPNSIIGFSTHDLQQARQATKLPIDYLAVGPIFTTDTKSDTAPVVGTAGLEVIRAALRELPIVAIGGINPSHAQQVFMAGADSIAMVSWLISDPSQIEERTRQFLSASSSQPQAR